jgi:two-component system, NarL family, sensor kinase
MSFALSGLIALTLIAIGGSLVLRHIGVSQAIDHASQLTTVMARGIIEPHLTGAFARGDPEAVAEVDATVREQVLSDQVVRVKIWDLDGAIIYSDEARLVGSVYPLDEDELASLETGEPAAALSDVARPENRFEHGLGQLLEVYVPVRTTSGRPLLFEAYLRFGSVVAGGRAMWLSFAPVLLSGLLLLELIQVPLARSLARRLRDSQLRRQLLLQESLERSDAERRRIAGDLHDGVVQDLVGVSYALTGVADRLESETPAHLLATIREAANDTRRGIRQLRSQLVEISPTGLGPGELEAGLRELLAVAEARGLRASLTWPEDSPPVGACEDLLFRVAREAIRNVISHADAEEVGVRLTRSSAAWRLTIEDDGVGFSEDELHRRRAAGHLGLRLMDELVRSNGGRLTVRSVPPRGTTIQLDLPDVGVAEAAEVDG